MRDTRDTRDPRDLRSAKSAKSKRSSEGSIDMNNGRYARFWEVQGFFVTDGQTDWQTFAIVVAFATENSYADNDYLPVHSGLHATPAGRYPENGPKPSKIGNLFYLFSICFCVFGVIMLCRFPFMQVRYLWSNYYSTILNSEQSSRRSIPGWLASNCFWSGLPLHHQLYCGQRKQGFCWLFESEGKCHMMNN